VLAAKSTPSTSGRLIVFGRRKYANSKRLAERDRDGYI
jgi:hypothetical protein